MKEKVWRPWIRWRVLRRWRQTFAQFATRQSSDARVCERRPLSHAETILCEDDFQSVKAPHSRRTISASCMHHVAGMVTGSFSLRERLVFEFVSKNISLQLEEELGHKVRDSLESLSLKSGLANHNTRKDLLNFVTHCEFGNRMQANLEDEELGRLGLSCHHALDGLCAELHAFWHLVYSSATIE